MITRCCGDIPLGQHNTDTINILYLRHLVKMSQIYNIHLLPKDNAAKTTTAMLQPTIDRRSLLTQAEVLCAYIAHIV